MSGRDFEIAALVYGLVTLVLLTVVALVLGDRVAVLLMLGAVCSAYVCQAAFAMAITAREDWLVKMASATWAASVIFSVAAVCHLVVT